MNAAVLVAGVVAVFGGLVHSYRGERNQLMPLFRDNDLPPVLAAAMVWGCL